jgi:hypothetical protein
MRTNYQSILQMLYAVGRAAEFLVSQRGLRA